MVVCVYGMSLLLGLDFCLVLVGVLVALVPGVVGAFVSLCFVFLVVGGCASLCGVG